MTELSQLANLYSSLFTTVTSIAESSPRLRDQLSVLAEQQAALKEASTSREVPEGIEKEIQQLKREIKGTIQRLVSAAKENKPLPSNEVVEVVSSVTGLLTILKTGAGEPLFELGEASFALPGDDDTLPYGDGDTPPYKKKKKA